MKDRKHSTSGYVRRTRRPALVYSLVALVVLMLILWRADRLIAARFGAFEPYQQMLWLYRILGLIIVAGLPTIAYLLVLRRGELVSMVDARTSELRAANQQLERQIADRLQTETALRESQQKLQAIFDHAFDGISIYEEIPSDRSHRLIDCNERYAEMAGRTREELLETSETGPFQRKVGPVRSREENLDIRRNKRPYRGTFSWIRPDGKENVVEYSATPIEMEDRPFTVGIDRDITERIKTEQALEAMSREWQTTFDAVTDGLCLLDAEQRVVRHNHAMEALFPAHRGRLTGMHCWELLQNSDRSITACPFESMRESLKRETMELPYEDRVLEISVDPILDDANQLTGAVHLIRDISKRKQTEELLRDYTEQLEDSVEARTKELRDAQDRLIRQERLAVLGELAGGVSHELRTPLGVITNAIYYLNLILHDPSDEVNEYLDMIDTEARNILRIASDLLDYARVRPNAPSPTDLLDLTLDAVNRHPTPESVSLQVDIPNDLPPVLVDRHQMGQVLDNLIANAYQAMPGGGHLTVTSARPGGRRRAELDGAGDDWVEIAVSDTGTGIPQENLERIFEPLFTTRAKGIGLGLAISRKLVEANGGTIRAESTEGTGSRFIVTLPAHRDGTPA